jgi:hypothetical protein
MMITSALKGVKRVLILGSPGAGKSWLGNRLAEALQLPLVRLDDLYWGPAWSRPLPEDFERRLTEAVCAEQWIIEGNYHQWLGLRLCKSQAVVLLDIPPWRCFFSVALRGLLRLVGDSQSLPIAVRNNPKNIHRIDIRFLKLIFGFRTHILPQMLKEIAAAPCQSLVLILQDRQDVHKLLAEVTIVNLES